MSAAASSPDGIFNYTYSGSSSSSPIAMITGYAQEYTQPQLVIPDEVTFNGVTYTITTASGLDGNQYIEEVVMGKNLKTCQTFRNCRNLKRFVVDADNPYIMVIDEAWLCQNYQLKDNPYLWTLAAGTATGDVTIPEGINDIMGGAFNGCDIDCLTFTGCVAPAYELIDAVGVYDDNHEYLGWEMLGTIRKYALADNLTQWNNNKQYFLEADALYERYYDGLTTTVSLISLPPGTDRSSLVINGSCDDINSGALASVASLRNLVIPASVTWMGGAFANDRDHEMSNIKNIVIGAGLSKVYLPTVNNVVKNVYCKALTPPEVEGIIISEEETGETVAGGVERLYVPGDAYEAYVSHESWGLVPEIVIYDIEVPGVSTTSSSEGLAVTWDAVNAYEIVYYVVCCYGDAALEQPLEIHTVNLGARSASPSTCTFDTLESDTDYWLTIEGFDYEGQSCYFDYQPIHTGQLSSAISINDDLSSDLQETAIYDITGRRLSTPAAGLNLIRLSDGTVLKRFIP